MTAAKTFKYYFLIVIICSTTTISHANNVKTSIEGRQRCISSNGIPDHSIGNFPNAGNPHRIAEQNIRYCFPLNPVKKSKPSIQHGSIGVALNGITIRPGTADYWYPSSSRGFSRNRNSGWNLEGLGSREQLGIDHNNAHVDNTGLYHYHGVASALVKSTTQQGSLIGYAADGFEIHYVESQNSSYQLKQGVRPSGPGGRYDGSYNQDWQYIAGVSSLDECNGGELNGRFVYFATDNYPFFPRCLWGNISADFGLKEPHQGDSQEPKQGAVNRQPQSLTNRDKPNQKRTPPSQAISACSNASTGQSCSFSLGGRSIQGVCRRTPDRQFACVPRRPAR